MLSKVILSVRNVTARELLSLDNTYKVIKTNNMRRILHDIESDTSLTTDDVRDMFNSWYKMALMLSSKNRSQMNYLKSYKDTYNKQLFVYFATFKTIYNVTESKDAMLSYIEDKWVDDSYDESNMMSFFKNEELVLMEYKGKLYAMSLLDDGCVISIIANEDGLLDFSFVLKYGYAEDSIRECDFTCCNVDCPHYKQSKGEMIGKTAKRVFCDENDINKCKMYEKTGILHSGDALSLFEAISCIMTERRTNGVVHEKRNDYEHLPVPERVDDVVVYFGKKKERKPLPFIRVDDIAVEHSSIPSSHASPREHQRRNGSRRSTMRFNPKTGKKDIKVRGCEKVSDCVVNKGHTKTSYTFRERKS